MKVKNDKFIVDTLRHGVVLRDDLNLFKNLKERAIQ